MNSTTTANVELCSKCRASIALTSYTLPFEDDFTRAYHNPSEPDTSAVESSLTDPSAELTALAQEIQRVELLLRVLKTHHTLLERHIDRTTRFIQSSPIRQLPTEVLGIIFASACNSFQQEEYKTPLSISLVCSKWRDISNSTPTLWTNIYVAPYSSACGLPVYKHFLQRCGGIPISVKAEIPNKEHPHVYANDNISYEETYDYHVEIVGDVYASFAQWKVAEFHMKRADVQLLEDLAFRWSDEMELLDAPLLESLTLAITDSPDTTSLPHIFSEAPLLSTVNLLDRSHSNALLWTRTQLPWGQLRRVHTDQANVAYLRYLDDDFQDEDRASSELVLNGPFDSSRTHFSFHPDVSFALYVTTLILNSHLWTESMCAFFDNVFFPILEDLTIISPDLITHQHRLVLKEWSNPLDAFCESLNSSHCKLRTFSLVMHGRHGNAFAGRRVQPTLADSLVNVLRIMRRLTRLQVIEAESGPPLLGERFSQELLNNTLLPELTSVELVWAEDRHPDSKLLSALSSRADGSLLSVVLGIRSGGELGQDVLECMRGLRQRNVQATCW